MRLRSPKLSKSEGLGRLHGRPIAAARQGDRRRSAASPDRPFVHHAAFSEGEGRQSGTKLPLKIKLTPRSIVSALGISASRLAGAMSAPKPFFGGNDGFCASL